MRSSHYNDPVFSEVLEGCNRGLKDFSVVVANLIITLDWRVRKVKKAATVEHEVFEEVLLGVFPLIGADRVVKSLCI